MFFCCFQILLSHNNNHLTAPCGLAAASDVEGERERGGEREREGERERDREREREREGGGEGGGRLMRLDSDQSRTLQRNTLMDLPPLLPAFPYRSSTECAHTPMHSISISGPDLGQDLLIYIWQHFDGESKAQTRGEN